MEFLSRLHISKQVHSLWLSRGWFADIRDIPENSIFRSGKAAEASPKK